MKLSVSVPVLASILLTAPLFSQAPPPPPAAATAAPAADPAGPLPSFLAADIHPSKSSPYPNMHGDQIFGDRYVLHEANAVDLIRTAYGTDANSVQGGPAWLERDRFEIIAKVPPHTTPVQARLMLRQLLVDRFQLVSHTGMKPMPAWALSVKDASKLKEAANPGSMNCKNDDPPATPGSGPPHVLHLNCTSAGMQWFTNLVRSMLGTNDSVIDKTNLTGVYDFRLTVTPAQLLPQAGADGIPIQQAVEKDLGLQLTHDTAPREVRFVDSLLRTPTPNAPDLATLLPPRPPVEFDVATVKISDPDAKGIQARIDGGQVNVHNITLKMLIPIAWNLSPIDENVVANAPKWFETAHYDIVAKVSPEALASNVAAGTALDIDDLRMMLQKLIVERLQMKVHVEDRPIDSYRLIAVNPKLRPADPTTRTVCKEGPGADGKDPRTSNPALDRLLTCTNMSMEEISEELQRQAPGYIHNKVENATGLEGRYDFTLSFSRAGNNPAPATNGDPNKPNEASEPNGAISLLEALPKELGLKLEKVKRPLPVLVIDSATEKPLEN